MENLRLTVIATLACACLLGSAMPAQALPVKYRIRHQLNPASALERPAIIGGATAPVGTFGMMAFISYVDPDTGDGFICSGTVISPNVVLTAGHCGEDTTTGTVYQAANYAVATGSLDWTDANTRQVSGVSNVVVDPDFDPSTLDADATLLVLTTPTTAPVIPLATTDAADFVLLDAGARADVAGWGNTVSGQTPDLLQWGTTVVQRWTYCQAQAAAADQPFDATRQVCAIDLPTLADGTCEGDSGGPLLAKRPDGTWVEIGITSSGPADCNTAQPDDFTRTDSMSGWADGVIQQAASGLTSGTPPGASTAPTPGPEAGTYSGETGQRYPIRIQVGSSGTSVSTLAFSFELRCSKHKPLAYSIRPGRRQLPWRLKEAQGMGFDDSFKDATGERYEVRGAFDGQGNAAGFLTTSWHTRQYGRCSSGSVSWHARLAT